MSFPDSKNRACEVQLQRISFVQRDCWHNPFALILFEIGRGSGAPKLKGKQTKDMLVHFSPFLHYFNAK